MFDKVNAKLLKIWHCQVIEKPQSKMSLKKRFLLKKGKLNHSSGDVGSRHILPSNKSHIEFGHEMRKAYTADKGGIAHFQSLTPTPETLR